MLHFRVLPSDPYYKQLTDEQIYLLFYGFLNLPEDSIVRSNYLQNKYAQTKKEAVPIEDLKRMGYSEDEIHKIIEAL